MGLTFTQAPAPPMLTAHKASTLPTSSPSPALRTAPSPAAIRAIDHVGLRVSDRRRSLAFYEALGFAQTASFPAHEANEMESPHGVRINLIFNGTRRRGAANVLLDAPVKLPGLTHVAFVVDDLEALRDWLVQSGITITEGPQRIGPRRVALFIRDPDGNVLEFNQLIAQQGDRSMRLYDLDLSGNCYKVRLFAALADIDLEIVPVDFLGGEHKRAPLTGLNPWGELPILVDGERVLRDSQAILVYLAGRYGGDAWWPEDPGRQAEVVQWLSTAANEVQNGPCAARLVDKFGYAIDKADPLARSARILPLIDAHLARHEWLALGRPTIADCAVYPYLALAPEGGVDLKPFVHIGRWIQRIKALPGYRAMPGL